MVPLAAGTATLPTMTSTAAALPSGGSLIPSAMEAGGSFLSSALSFLSAERQMRFQKSMSNSAHQREVKDLRAAGLNPILSAGGSGASQPVGASVTPENPLRGLTQAMQQRRLQRYQIANMDAENAKLLKEANKIDQDARLSSALADKAITDNALGNENLDLTARQIITENLRQKGIREDNLNKEYENIIKEAQSGLYKGPGRYILPLIDKANETVGLFRPLQGAFGQQNYDQRQMEVTRDKRGNVIGTKTKETKKVPRPKGRR